MTRFFGTAAKKSPAPVARMSQLQASTREQTQRQVLTMALRDTLKRNGMLVDGLTAEAVPGASGGRGRGMHVQLVFREWAPELLPYVVALEQAFRTTLRRMDPLSPGWVLGITWRFEPKNPLACPQLPALRNGKPEQAAQAAGATTVSRTAFVDTLLQAGEAAFPHRASADFSPTQPMPAR
jgi:hypothetical protein